MNKLIAHLVPAAAAKLDRAYVSEYTDFINRFLAEHPEVVDDQWAGRALYWDRKVDLADQQKARQDSVPDDGYGFSPTVWGNDVKARLAVRRGSRVP